MKCKNCAYYDECPYVREDAEVLSCGNLKEKKESGERKKNDSKNR